MKTGASPRPTLLVTAGSGEGRRPGPHVARWVGPEQDAAGCACHGRDGRAGAGDDRGAGRRRVGLAGVSGRGVRPAGDRGDRVDDRRPFRARSAGAARLAGADRRCGEGQGAGAAGGQDRQDRCPGAGRVVPPGAGAGDLAAGPDGARRAGAGRWRLHLVRHRTAVKNRIHAILMAFGHPCPVSDLFGVAGRRLLDGLALPEPWAGDVAAALRLIDSLDGEIADCEAALRTAGADHPYVPLLMTVPGIGWVLGYTIAAEIGDIARFDSPKKLVGYTGLCPTVYQSGRTDHRDSLAKNGPKYLRWALIEATTHAARHPVYAERYQRTKTRLGKQRGPKVARVELARKLAEAIWYMLTTSKPFAPAGAAKPLAA